MRYIIRFTFLLVLISLAACGGSPDEVVVSPAASAVLPPTETIAPSATVAAPTSTAQPTATLVPTEAPPTATQATATVEATPTATAASAETETAAPAETVVTSITTPTPTVGTTKEGVAIRPDLPGVIAFVRGGDIYVYRPQTGAVERLIENGRDMRFSSDGTQIAFVRDDGLYLAQADGSNIRRIAAQPNIRAPRWTDDDTKLLFERVSDPTTPGRGEIWTIEMPGGSPLKIATGADPAWSPEGKRVAYVTEATGERRRNQLRLTNWRGQNDWGPVKNLPDNIPAIGIPGQQLPPNQLEHMMFDPLWSANGRSIYVPAFVLTQIETDFAILERADATNGDSTFVSELPGAIDAFQSPDRQAAVFTVGSPRGDIRLIARPLDPAATDRYAWAETHDVAMSEAPTWAPDSQALVYVRCSLETTQRCDLALLAPGQREPAVLIRDLFGSETPDRNPAPFVAWGK